MALALKSMTNRRIVVCALVAVLAAILARETPPNVLGDDAAITLRYVNRFVDGHGLTYNDHERVLGLSNPLYALSLAPLVWAGLDGPMAARLLDAGLFVTAVVLTTLVTAGLAGELAGVTAGVLLAVTWFFRYQSLSGLEPILSVCLGLAAVRAASARRERQAGVFLGLAIWNKLDALLLALSTVGALAFTERRLPRRLVLACVLTCAPWMLFAWWYYGSPIPHSLVVKLEHGADGSFDHGWVLRAFTSENRWGLVAVAAGVPLVWQAWSAPQRRVILSLGGWFVAHAVAVSALRLGDYYPWYLAVLFPPLVISSVATAAMMVRQWRTSVWRRALATVAFLIVASTLAREAQVSFEDLRAGTPLKSWEAFDADRRLAGVFLREHADPTEVVQSAFGWPAFEVPNPFNDESGLNTIRARTDVSYIVRHGEPYQLGSRPPATPEGFEPVATFNLASSLFPGYSWFVVYGAPRSAIVLSGRRRVELRLFELPEAMALEGTPPATLDGIDLVCHSNSGLRFSADLGGQPATLVFTPSIDTPARPSSARFVIRDATGRSLYERTVGQAESRSPVSVQLSPGGTAAVAFSLATLNAQDAEPVVARWQDVRIVIGNASISVDPLGDSQIITAWRERNPPAESGLGVPRQSAP